MLIYDYALRLCILHIFMHKRVYVYNKICIINMCYKKTVNKYIHRLITKTVLSLTMQKECKQCAMNNNCKPDQH